MLYVHFDSGALLEVSIHVREISELRGVRSTVAENQTRPRNTDQTNRSYKIYVITVYPRFGILPESNNDLYACLGKEASQ